ncbi:hypothetical protein B0H11DRAFT_1959149 [Mycena galericulata]|nr:hypothetical protein B0H11DRAFT_1959149 [Mycena galericulata]
MTLLSLPFPMQSGRKRVQWYYKILDQTRNLGVKWAIEAGLAEPNAPMSAQVAGALEELEREAQKIIFCDFKIQLNEHVESGDVDSNIESFHSDILSSLRYAASSLYGVRAPTTLSEEVGVFFSDDLVPASLHRELVEQLDALAKREPQDFHPGSHGKVQDLIHPSLYPLVLGESVLDDVSKSSTLPSLFSTDVTMAELNPTTLSSRYSWIPSVFEVSEDGKDVRIQSYINGLGPREHFPRLYRLIEKVFLLALPHLEQTLGFEYEPDDPPSVVRWKERWLMRIESDQIKRSAWQKMISDQTAEKNREQAQMEANHAIPKVTEVDPTDRAQFASDDTIDAFSFQGRQLKVIVKAANYQLKAGQTYEGTWHMEGMPHERIVASVIYYYDTDPAIVDQGLEFRKPRDPGVDFPTFEHYRHESFRVTFRSEADSDSEDEDYEDYYDETNLDSTSDYPSDWDYTDTSALPRYLYLGCVPTTNFTASEKAGTGRMLSFPNWIQHRVGKLSVVENAPNDSVAKRKILCFFLVDDDDEHFESED